MDYILKNNYSTITDQQDAIFSALNDPALIYDVHLKVKKVNTAFLETYHCDLAGLHFKEVISMFSCKWLDESRYLFHEQPTVRAVKGEKSSGYIFSLQHKGKELFVKASAAPIYEDGKITGALTIWQTVDEPERFNLAIQRSGELHRRIDDSSPVGIIISKDGIIEYANNTALKILGARHLVDIEGKAAFDFFHPRFEKLLSRRIESFHGGKIVEEAEQKIIRMDGDERDVEVMAINTPDLKNKVIHLYLRDITSQKKLNFFNNILSSIEQVIQSSVNILQITQQAMEMVGSAFNCDSGAVTFLKDQEWEVKHVYKFNERIKGLIIPCDEEPHAMLALKEKKIVFIEDAFTDPRANNDRLKEWGIRSVIVVPLYTRHVNIGVIIFNYYNKKVFNHEEIYFLIRFSTALSLALENSELFDNLQHELALKKTNEKKLIKLNNILLALSRSSQAMVHATSERDYINHICEIITSDCDQALAWVGFPEGNIVIPKIWSGNSKDYIKLVKVRSDNSSYFFRGPATLAIKNRRAFVCNSISEEPDFEPWRTNALELGLNSSISLPLIHQNQVFGVLNIYSKENDFYGEDEILLLSELAKYLSQGIVSIRLDVAKKQAEESLVESEERFRMITEKSNALICELDIKGRVIYANAQYLDIFGWDDPFSSSILDNCRPSDRVNFQKYIYNPDDTISRTEWILKDKCENWRWFRCHPGIFKTTRGGKHYSLVLFDISESKLSEHQLKRNAKELKELNATKDKFFTIIAHDLKNPFANLIGASELLANGSGFEPETVQRLGKILNDSARRGFNLLQNLLDWSRAQTGTISFDPTKIVLIDLINDCWDNVKASAFGKKQTVEFTVPEHLEIFADKNMLNTVIRNLIQNAIKFTHEGGFIKVVASKNKKGVTVTVEDNGIGMSGENMKKLFRIDVKYLNPGTNKETGTGLGLLLCKEFVEKHGGNIWVKSTEGHGCKFSFKIPAQLPEVIKPN